MAPWARGDPPRRPRAGARPAFAGGSSRARRRTTRSSASCGPMATERWIANRGFPDAGRAGRGAWPAWRRTSPSASSPTHALREPRPAQGRVPRDARARAAQPARPDPQRGRDPACAADSARDARARARDDRPPGDAPRAPGGRPARRLAHHAGQDRAAAGRRWSWHAVVDARDRAGAPVASSARATSSTVDAARASRSGSTPTRCACTQIVGNLLNNAAKFTPPAGAITLTRGAPSGEAWRSRVEDNGIGMPADLLPHIFELFAQGDRSLERARGGLGIGLSLVKRLVEMHGGTVSAAQRGPGPGQPLRGRRCRSSPAPRPRRAARGRSAGAVAPARRDPGGRRQPRFAPKPSRCCSSGRATTVATAFDAIEALAKARRFRAGGDLPRHRPARHGRLRSSRGACARCPRSSGARMLALTGYGQADASRAARCDAGFDDHLVKPFDPQQLDRVIG